MATTAPEVSASATCNRFLDLPGHQLKVSSQGEELFSRTRILGEEFAEESGGGDGATRRSRNGSRRAEQVWRRSGAEEDMGFPVPAEEQHELGRGLEPLGNRAESGAAALLHASLGLRQGHAVAGIPGAGITCSKGLSASFPPAKSSVGGIAASARRQRVRPRSSTSSPLEGLGVAEEMSLRTRGVRCTEVQGLEGDQRWDVHYGSPAASLVLLRLKERRHVERGTELNLLMERLQQLRSHRETSALRCAHFSRQLKDLVRSSCPTSPSPLSPSPSVCPIHGSWRNVHTHASSPFTPVQSPQNHHRRSATITVEELLAPADPSLGNPGPHCQANNCCAQAFPPQGSPTSPWASDYCMEGQCLHHGRHRSTTRKHRAKTWQHHRCNKSSTNAKPVSLPYQDALVLSGKGNSSPFTAHLLPPRRSITYESSLQLEHSSSLFPRSSTASSPWATSSLISLDL